ncbi:hypothetical protein QWZ10_02005 [Paracoccus cavernae]|uniref:Uncharacterized protein n=1 Tax=Paracoccus cavernae TaxID=1571207 RepID=A0ABT8D2N8_9RHOB|nr:hypothetical protein [Paracoccus cavernae]
MRKVTKGRGSWWRTVTRRDALRMKVTGSDTGCAPPTAPAPVVPCAGLALPSVTPVSPCTGPPATA